MTDNSGSALPAGAQGRWPSTRSAVVRPPSPPLIGPVQSFGLYQMTSGAFLFQLALPQPEENDRSDDENVKQAGNHPADHRGGERFHDSYGLSWKQGFQTARPNRISGMVETGGHNASVKDAGSDDKRAESHRHAHVGVAVNR